MAASSAKARKIRSGGIAAIFASPYSAGNTVTVISATNASDFAASASALSAPEHWNALRGGVVRWNKTQIVMAQAETGLPAVPTVSAAVTAQSKLNGWKTKLAALLPSRNTQKPAPQQTTPQPAAKAQPIATAPSAPISLRGASSPARVSGSEVHKMSANTQGASSLPNMKLPKIAIPDFKIAKPEFSKANFDISSEFAKAKRSVQQSYGEIMSGQFFRKASNFFDANRQLSLILAAFAGLILIGFAVPKPSN